VKGERGRSSCSKGEKAPTEKKERGGKRHHGTSEEKSEPEKTKNEGNSGTAADELVVHLPAVEEFFFSS
jgi:hypothetical protein